MYVRGKITCQKQASNICRQKYFTIVDVQLWKKFSSIGCNPHKLVPSMRAFVANAITIFKTKMIDTYFRPFTTLKSNPKP